MVHNDSIAQGTDRVRRLLTRASVGKALPFLAFGILIVVAIVVVGQDIAPHMNAIESWITQLGPWGPLAFVVLFVLLTSMLMPDTVLCIIAGALFGFAWGAAAILAGSLLAAALHSRSRGDFLKAKVERVLLAKPSLSAIARAVTHDELRLQLLLRLAPLNPATISYLLARLVLFWRIPVCLLGSRAQSVDRSLFRARG